MTPADPAGAIAVTPEQLRRQVARLKTVPTLPRLLERVIAILEDPEVNFESVAEVVEVDQALASQILRLANSAFYSRQGAVSRVSQALVMLGAVVTRSVVLSSSVLDLREVSLRGFWEHSLGCATAAGAIAKVSGKANPEEAVAAGLLHDLGKVVLFKQLPEAFAYILERAEVEQRSFRELERDVLGVDHCEIAAWLVDHWRFPPALAEPIKYHHEPGRAVAAPDLTAIVHVANTLVRGLGYGSGGDQRVPPVDAKAWARLALDAAGLDRVLERYDADLDYALNYALFE